MPAVFPTTNDAVEACKVDGAEDVAEEGTEEGQPTKK